MYAMVLSKNEEVTKEISRELSEFLDGEIPQVSFLGLTSYGYLGVMDIVDSTKIASCIEDDRLEIY